MKLLFTAKKLTLLTTRVCHSSRCFLLVDCVLLAQQHFLCFAAVPGAPICLHAVPQSSSVAVRCGY